MSSIKKVSATSAAPAPLPTTGFLRLSQIVGDKTCTPPLPGLIPVCKSAWWSGVRTGRFPQPIKLSPRVTVWRVEDIRELIVSAGQGAL